MKKKTNNKHLLLLLLLFCLSFQKERLRYECIAVREKIGRPWWLLKSAMQRFSNIRTLSRMAAECGGARCVSEKYLHTTPPPTHDCAGNTPSTRFLYTNQRLCLLRDNKWRPRFCAQSSLNSGTEWNGRSARWTMCWSNNTQTHDALWSLFVFFNYHIASWWNKRRGILIGLFLHQATCCLFFRLAVSSGRCNRRWLCACHLRNNTIPEYPDCLNSVIALIPVILTHLLLHSSLDSLWWLRWSLSSNSDRVAPDTLLAVGASFRIQLERARSTGYVSCHRWFSSTIWFETNNQSECWCYFGSQLMRIYW